MSPGASPRVRSHAQVAGDISRTAMSIAKAASLYDAYYFATGCGLPYNRQEKHWSVFFGRVADRIINDFPNTTILDAGCALGFLVEALRERGVEAYGIDISDYAIENVAEPVRPFCRVRSVTDPLPRPYDLIVCIEVLEHLQPADAEEAVANFCRHADEVLFSSSPFDYKEATHFNVQPPDYWAELFAKNGFHRDLEYDATYITKWATRFRRGRDALPRVVRTYERRMWQLEKETQGNRDVIVEQRAQLANHEDNFRRLETELQEKGRAHEQLTEEHAKAIRTILEDWPQREQLMRQEHERQLNDCREEVSRQGELIGLLDQQRNEIQSHADEERRQRLEQAGQSGELLDRIEVLANQSAAREKAIQVLSDELHRHQHMVREKELATQALGAQLADLRASRSFRLAQKLRRLRLALLPPGSYRFRSARLVYRAARLWRREGTVEAIRRSVRKIRSKLGPAALSAPPPFLPAPSTPAEAITLPPPDTLETMYSQWIKQNEPSDWELEQQSRAVFPYRPMISVVVPAYNTPIPFLVAMIESVRGQTYANWELCVADGGSPDPLVRQALDAYAARDSRIRIKRLERNLGIAGNSNQALAMATGDFVCLLDHDDTLTPFALFEIARAINQNPEADFLYSDEDKIDASGSARSQPHFKPDWSPDTMRSHNYICHLSCFRRDLIERTGGFRPGFDGSQDYDLILRATEQAKRIVHIRKILYHWRMHEASCANAPEAKLYAYDSAKKALRDHLERIGVDGLVKDGKTLGVYEIDFALKERPLISIIITNKDNRDMLERCMRSIATSTYDHYEIIIVENNSTEDSIFDLYAQLEQDPRVRIVNWSGPFNYSAVNNFGVQHATGEVLLFLNNDIEAINADWMERMLQHIQRPGVGAVGAKLLYPNNTVQHGGVIVGLGGIAGHAHQKFPGWHYGYFGRLIITHNLSAVTAACLMTTRKVFDEAGGFDIRYVLAFNDVDLCVKIRQKGHLIVWTPFAELYHHESLTRGQDDTPDKLARFIREAELFATEWCDVLEAGDPYYHPAFTLQKADFSYRLAPETDWKLSNFLLTTSRGKASIGMLRAA